MTLAYAADALVYDVDRDGYALRVDYDPALHRVDIAFGQEDFWPTGSQAGWNDPDDPPIAHVRNLSGVPVQSGHAYVADRLSVTGPDGATLRIDVLEIDHDPIGFIATSPLTPGHVYRLADPPEPYRTTETPPIGTGFGPGTMIATTKGELPVEWLAVGDEILTFGGTPQPLRWVGCTRVSASDAARQPGLRPVHLCAGAPGRSTPLHDLCLGRETQVMLSGAQVSLNFGLDHALARAGDLDEPDSAPIIPRGSTFFALLFDQHQIVLANGQWCGSLFADPRLASQLARQFPTIPAHIRHDRFALPGLTDWEVRLIRPYRTTPAPQRLVVAA